MLWIHISLRHDGHRIGGVAYITPTGGDGPSKRLRVVQRHASNRFGKRNESATPEWQRSNGSCVKTPTRSLHKGPPMAARSKSDEAFGKSSRATREELEELFTSLYGDPKRWKACELMNEAHAARPDLKRLDTKRVADPE